MKIENTKRQAKWLRAFRWLHRRIAVLLFIFFFIISVTGLLLGWKKDTGLLAPTQKGASAEQASWLSVDSLSKMAFRYLHDSVSANLSPELDRIDIRPDKGIAKYVFKNHYWGLQLDCSTGALLLIEKRRSDFIEDLHDGSILDSIFNTGSEVLKLGYSTIMALSLLMLTITGVWLWWGPKVLRKARRH